MPPKGNKFENVDDDGDPLFFSVIISHVCIHQIKQKKLKKKATSIKVGST